MRTRHAMGSTEAKGIPKPNSNIRNLSLGDLSTTFVSNGDALLSNRVTMQSHSYPLRMVIGALEIGLISVERKHFFWNSFLSRLSEMNFSHIWLQVTWCFGYELLGTLHYPCGDPCSGIITLYWTGVRVWDSFLSVGLVIPNTFSKSPVFLSLSTSAPGKSLFNIHLRLSLHLFS